MAFLPFPVTGYPADSPWSIKNSLLLFHFHYFGGELFWHFCDILVSCLLSLVSLGTYLKGNRFIVKHVGLFILRSYFIAVEIEWSEEAPDLEWSRQPGTVNASLVGLLVALDKGWLLTCAVGALFWASWFRGSALALRGHPFPRPVCGGLSQRPRGCGIWNPGACHLCSLRLRYLGPRIFQSKSPQLSSRVCCVFPLVCGSSHGFRTGWWLRSTYYGRSRGGEGLAELWNQMWIWAWVGRSFQVPPSVGHKWGGRGLLLALDSLFSYLREKSVLIFCTNLS